MVSLQTPLMWHSTVNKLVFFSYHISTWLLDYEFRLRFYLKHQPSTGVLDIMIYRAIIELDYIVSCGEFLLACDYVAPLNWGSFIELCVLCSSVTTTQSLRDMVAVATRSTEQMRTSWMKYWRLLRRTVPMATASFSTVWSARQIFGREALASEEIECNEFRWVHTRFKPEFNFQLQVSIHLPRIIITKCDIFKYMNILYWIC